MKTVEPSENPASPFLPLAAIIAVACLVGWFFVSPFGYLYIAALAMWGTFIAIARRGGSTGAKGFLLRLFLIVLANIALMAAAAPRIAESPTVPVTPGEQKTSASAESIGAPVPTSGELSASAPR